MESAGLHEIREQKGRRGQRIIESAGVHVTLDAFVKDPSVFRQTTLTGMFVDLVRTLDMEILVGPNFIEVPVDPEVLRKAQETGVFADEGGITGTCIISKSHVSLHAWPLQKFFSFDVFSCGDFDPQVAIDLVEARMGVTASSINIINRRKPIVIQPAVYCITNKVNGKKYVGKAKDPTSRWAYHVWLSTHPDHRAFSAVHAAIAKYGQSSFIFETLEVCDSESRSYELEHEYILALKSNQPAFGYNLNAGGLGGKSPSPEIRARISQSNKGKHSGAKNGMFGRKGAAHPNFGKKLASV